MGKQSRKGTARGLFFNLSCIFATTLEIHAVRGIDQARRVYNHFEGGRNALTDKVTLYIEIVTGENGRIISHRELQEIK